MLIISRIGALVLTKCNKIFNKSVYKRYNSNNHHSFSTNAFKIALLYTLISRNCYNSESSIKSNKIMEERVDQDRHYQNPFIGLEPKVSESFKKEIESHAKILLRNLQKRIEKESLSFEDSSIYTGITGNAFLYWHLSRHNHPEAEILNKQAVTLVEHSLKHLKGKRVSFLCGDAGPLAMAVAMYSSSGQKEKATFYLEKLIRLQNIVFQENDSVPNEILYGRAGYLYSLLFVNQFLEKKIDSAFISTVAEHIISEGVEASQNSILYYEWHDKCYFGAAHGYSGILYMLLKARDYLKPESDDRLKKAIDWLLTQRFSSGNLRSSLGSKYDRLVHWCHGSTGAIYLWIEAHKIYGDEKYLTAAIEAADVIWKRGLLKKGYGLCHGVSGNAYALHAMYKHTNEIIYLQRSYLFAKWCFDYGSKCVRTPDRPLSLFEGLAGAVYMLYDLTYNSTKFPAFEL